MATVAAIPDGGMGPDGLSMLPGLPISPSDNFLRLAGCDTLMGRCVGGTALNG